MAGKIPNLWPADKVSVSTLSPVAIMRAQGQYLQEQTLGLLVGEVTTKEVTSNDGRSAPTSAIYYYFEVVAPTLDGCRHCIFKIRQDTALPYPVLYTEVPDGAVAALGFHPNATLLQAGTDAEFVTVLKDVFSSRQALSVINSLIAQINEVRSGAAELQWDEGVEG